MARLCERPGCSSPAEVSYGFDADLLVVWLDVFAGPLGVRSGVLCLRHANAMVVPLGWMLDDRREPVPRLFRSPATAEVTGSPKRRRTARATDDTEQLLLDPELVARIAEEGCDEEPMEVPVLAAQVPASGDEATATQLADAAPGTDGAPVEARPWQPTFDPADDLSGLLRARGRLLSRAFGGVAKPE